MFGMSLATFILVFNWLLEGRFREKLRRLWSTRSLWIFLIIFMVHIVWLIPSENLNYGLHDLKIKLPLLVFPLIIGTAPPISTNELRIVLNAFVLSVITGTVISIMVLTGCIQREITNIRDISIFISHIRFGLMIVLSIFFLGYDAFMQSDSPIWIRVLRMAGMVWLIVFIMILKSLTAMVILVIMGLVLCMVLILRSPHFMLKYFLSILWITCILVMVLTGFRLYAKFSYRVPVDLSTLQSHTQNSCAYHHDTLSQEAENGYLTWLYVCEEELENGWNKRSAFDYNGRDRNGNELRYTLIRYMTSKGLRKDSLGLTLLSDEDISWIEQGMANAMYTEGYTFSRLFYEFAWQWDVYRKGGNPSGHSVTQRIEYLKAGWLIFKKYPVFGVGTGDVPDAFDRQYQEMNSLLSEDWRLRAHNQYLTFLISFGLVGFLMVVWGIIQPAIMEQGFSQYRFTIFIIIVLLSMINEDTLETSAGAMFVAFFYTLLLFRSKSESYGS